MSAFTVPLVIPAKAGIQEMFAPLLVSGTGLDSRLRGNDGLMAG